MTSKAEVRALTSCSVWTFSTWDVPGKMKQSPSNEPGGEGGHRGGQSPRQGCLVRRDPLLCNSNCTIAQGLLLSPLAAR